jgi:hypothetical protein
MLLYHDKSYKAKDYIRKTFERNDLTPNRRFDNSLGRDNKMYHLSDLSNLENKSPKEGVNQIDRYLALEQFLPHKETLAIGNVQDYY